MKTLHDKEKGRKIELFNNKWLSLWKVVAPDKGVNGYVYSHETRCQGKIVAILPYRVRNDHREYLIKSEVTPCWGMDFTLSSITGGYEGYNIKQDAIRELYEEAGYFIQESKLIELGTSYASKSSDTVYSLYTTDLTNKRRKNKAKGDGSRLESESKTFWLPKNKMVNILDPQISVMLLRIENIL